MSDTEIISLIAKASWFAQGVLLVLVLMLFVVVWFVIRKVKIFSRVAKDASTFEEDFWGAGQIEEIRARAEDGEYGQDGIAPIFLTGYAEFDKSRRAANKDPQLAIEGIRTAMASATDAEIDRLEEMLPYLATTAGSSPYIGLLGTVVGIINAFRSIASSEQATIAQVAPGIAEALIATAMALLTAIPAVIAYNHLSARVNRFQTQFDNFADHFCNIIRRNM